MSCSSNTLFVSEVLGFQSKNDGRGAWLWGGMGGCSFTAWRPPNAKGTGSSHANYDKIAICGPPTGTDAPKYQCEAVSSTSDGTAYYASARSAHGEGVNACFGDNNTRFISDTINPAVWQAMATRNGPDTEVQVEF